VGVAARALVIGMALVLLAPAGAQARHGGSDDEVRAAGTCGGGATSRLRVKARDGALEAEAEVGHVRRGSRWRVTLVQEGRVVWRGRATARSSGFRVERRLRDLAGADRVSFRAWGPRGLTCRAAATLAGD
jgi:hypothetical protein